MTLLDIRHLKVCFRTARGPVSAVSDVNISVAKGEIVGVVGESGCGKTVTALSTMRLLSGKTDVSGEILFGGEDLLSKSEDEMKRLRGDRISMIFQEPMTSLNPVLQIGYQLTEPLRLHRGASREEAEARARAVLETVQVPNAAERMRAYPHQLSGGLCQRAMIAMALICEPDLLIADEPTTALDVTIQAQILALLKQLRDDFGTAIMMITHDLGVVAELCDRVYVMYAGHMMEHSGVFQIFDNPLHPYTFGLMNAMPNVGCGYREERELFSIPGMVPDLADLPPGCPFWPRCPDVKEICRAEIPALVEISEAHYVRCWKYSDLYRVRGIGRHEGRGG